MNRLVCLFALLPLTAAAADTAASSDDEGIKYSLDGYLRLKGGVVANDPDVTFIGRNDGFMLQNARLGVWGFWKRISVRVSGEGAVDEREGANATSGTLRFQLKDAFADILWLKGITVRVARFPVTFDLEEKIPDNERAFVDDALESRGVMPTEGWESKGLSPKRSIGVALRSDQVVGAGQFALGYEVALQNGNDEFASVSDNDALAVSATLLLSYGDAVGLILAARHNPRTEGEVPTLQTEIDDSAVVALMADVGPFAFAAQGIAQKTSYPTTDGADEIALGGHGQLLWRLPSLCSRLDMEIGYRYAILDPSDLITTDRTQEHTVGTNVTFKNVPVRLQLNYTRSVEQSARVLANDRGEAVFQVTL